MSDYDQTIRILRRLSVSGNTVATTYLHILYNCNPDEREPILRQIRSFATSMIYEVSRPGPSEFKGDESTTPILEFRV